MMKRDCWDIRILRNQVVVYQLSVYQEKLTQNQEDSPGVRIA